MPISSSALVGFFRAGAFEQGTGYGESFDAIVKDAWAMLHPDQGMPERTEIEVHVRNIVGPLAWADLTKRERCLVCGMTANIDPEMHTDRYDHRPEVRRGGKRWRFSFSSYAFTELVPEAS